MTSSAETRPVLIVGAGISGLACARALRAAGIATRMVERGRVVGGRMASRRFEGRPVDLGAAFFTADLASPFGAVVRDWLDRGLARPWTETLWVSEPGQPLVPKAGPMRYAAPAGLRSLLTDLADGVHVELEQAIDSLESLDSLQSPDSFDSPGVGGEYSAMLLAMPDPQARRLLTAGSPAFSRLNDASGWTPTIAVALGWPERDWPADFHGAFVNGSPVLSFLADDGDRRGDGAPVLVAHSSAELAAQHLEDPDAAIPPITEAVCALLELAHGPRWSYAHRWTFARPLAGHPEPFLLIDDADGRDGYLGVCGDGWGASSGGSSSVGAAWTSGDALGREVAARLSSSRL